MVAVIPHWIVYVVIFILGMGFGKFMTNPKKYIKELFREDDQNDYKIN